MAKKKDKSLIGKIKALNQDYHYAIGLFLLALVIRYMFLNAGLWYTDSVIAAQSVESTVETGILDYMHGVGYPGNVLTISFFYVIAKIFGAANAEFTTLFTSVFFGSLSVGLLYLLVKKISDSIFAALSAALILNFLPVYLSTSTFGMSHQLAIFFILLSFYLALNASKEQNTRLLVLAGICLGWATAVRLESLQMFPLTLMFYWRYNPPFSVSMKEGFLKFKSLVSRDVLLRGIAVFVVAMVLTAAIPYTPMFREFGTKPLVDAFEYNRWLGFWVPGLTEQVIDWVSISMTTLGWVLVLLGLVALLMKEKKAAFILVAVWCLYFLVLANTRTVEDRHTLPALVGFTVAMGFGLDWIYTKVHKYAGILVLLIIVGWMFSTVYPILDYRSEFSGAKNFAYTLRDTVDDPSIVIVMDEGPHLEYYGGLEVMGHPPDGNREAIQENLIKILGYLDNGTNVYMVSTALVYDVPVGLSYQQDTGVIYDPELGVVYKNLVFNPRLGSIMDKSTGVSELMYGRWQVELFNAFKLTPLKHVDNEDWHKKSVMFGKFQETIYKVEMRPK